MNQGLTPFPPPERPTRTVSPPESIEYFEIVALTFSRKLSRFTEPCDDFISLRL